MIAALQLRAGASKVVVANNNASSGIAKGRQFERWCHADFDKATIEHDIVALQQAGRDGVVALVHAGEPCTAAALALGLVIHALVFSSSSSSSRFSFFLFLFFVFSPSPLPFFLSRARVVRPSPITMCTKPQTPIPPLKYAGCILGRSRCQKLFRVL